MVNKLNLLFRREEELKRSCVCCVSVLSDPDSGGHAFSKVKHLPSPRLPFDCSPSQQAASPAIN
jgi:hypothetical protein